MMQFQCLLLGAAGPPEDTAAKATWNKKKVNLRQTTTIIRK